MDPLPLVVCGAAAALYALGRRGRTRVWRELSFYSGVALAFAPSPIYAAYPSLTDQQLAAGVMWVPGSLTYFVAAFFFFYRWLEPGDSTAPAAESRPEELSWT